MKKFLFQDWYFLLRHDPVGALRTAQGQLLCFDGTSDILEIVTFSFGKMCHCEVMESLEDE